MAAAETPRTSEVALVTGANRGLGQGIARHLGRAGLTVLVGARTPARAHTAARDLIADGLQAVPLTIDLTDPATARTAAETVDAEFGRLDLLVNNAGVLPEAAVGTVVDLDTAMVRTTLDTNVVGTTAVTQAMLPLLRRAAAGRIVMVSSSLGSLTLAAEPGSRLPIVPAYQASKAALSALTISLHRLLADTPLSVTAVCPGFVDTDIHPTGQGRSGARSADDAGEFVAGVALNRSRPSGQFIDREGTVPW